MASSLSIYKSGLTLTWMCLSATLVFLNKYVLATSSFKYPISLALLHMLSCTIICHITFLVAPSLKNPQANIFSDVRTTCQFLGISALFAFSLTCSNAALGSLDVATVQIFKALNPVMIYAIGVISGLDVISLRTTTILLLICTGVVVSVRGALEFHSKGLILLLFSITADSTRYICLQTVLQSRHVKLDALNVLSVVAPTTAVLVWLPASYIEFPHMTTIAWHAPAILVAASCILACLLNVASNAFIHATSALTMSVAGVLKDVVMITSSVVFLNTSVTPLEYFGYSLTMVASFVYSCSKRRK